MKQINKVLAKINEYINNFRLYLKKINKKNIVSFIRDRKYLISVVLLIIILLIMVCGKIFTNSREELVKKLESSMKTGSSRKIAGDVLVNDNKVSKTELDHLIKYYSADMTKLEKTISELRSNGQSGVFKIKNDRRGIWRNHYLEVKPVSLKVNTNFEGVKIFIDNEELKDTNIKQGLIPGVHIVKALLKTEYGDVEKETQVSLIENEEIDINLDATYLNITSNFPDSKVFINDKDINKKVNEIENYGPVPIEMDTKIELQREFPWGIIKSEKVNVSNSPIINININMVNEELTTQIEATINEFYESVFNALNKKDYSLIVSANDESKRKIYEEINKKSLILKNNYKIIDLETKIENSEFKYEDNIYKAQIVVKINYSIYKKLFLTSKEKEEAMFLINMNLVGDEWIVKDLQRFNLE